MPGIADVGLDQEKTFSLLEGICSTVVVRDILEREKRRGYDVVIGKIDHMEVDFIASTADERKYAQVTESIHSEDVRKRELAPLQKIRDNYEKIVLSLDPGLDHSYDGIPERGKNYISPLKSPSLSQGLLEVPSKPVKSNKTSRTIDPSDTLSLKSISISVRMEKTNVLSDRERNRIGG